MNLDFREFHSITLELILKPTAEFVIVCEANKSDHRQLLCSRAAEFRRYRQIATLDFEVSVSQTH